MNVLDSPIEALALDYLSYGFLSAVNNVWALLAVITAAVSFWRIRALSSPPVLSQDAVKVTEKAVAAELAAASSSPVTPASTAASCGGLEREGSTKTKFSVYYEEEDFREFDVDDGDDEGGAAVVSEKLGRLCDDWERMMVVRMGDLGWYRCQDTTVLGGSVVRLWEGCRWGWRE